MEDELIANPQTWEEKQNWLLDAQKQLLDIYLEHGAISRTQYDKSLGDLILKMGVKQEIKSDF